MSNRSAARLAWSAWAATVLLTAGAIALASRNVDTLGGAGRATTFALLGTLWTVGYATVGAILASRRPSNPIGWIFCANGLVIALTALAEEYATRGLVSAPGSLEWARVAAWFQNWGGYLAFTLLWFLVVLFPDGRLLSRRWRWLAWGLVGVAAVLVASAMLSAKRVESWFRLVPLHTSNLTGVHALGSLPWAVNQGGWVVAGAVFVVAGAVPLIRLRRARGEERQQLLWFVYAGALFAATVTVGVVGDSLGAGFWVNYPLSAGLLALPVATGIAVMRYRLYDIDRIINRTLVYGALTVLLGGLYVGLAVGLGSLAGRNNSLVIAGSTLVVAALFRPARRRVQEFIDRRFYRRKYDAQRTLEAFTARLRDHVDLEQLRLHLLAVVDETMQPAQASLWLRGTGARP
ncbi:MAG: hypothetical protein M3Q23_13465 [Actinomycetota bacterium]|nr:hypothetical protein [Actinomycetota bacterium]